MLIATSNGNEEFEAIEQEATTSQQVNSIRIGHIRQILTTLKSQIKNDLMDALNIYGICTNTIRVFYYNLFTIIIRCLPL